jgi:hypothetical protein
MGDPWISFRPLQADAEVSVPHALEAVVALRESGAMRVKWRVSPAMSIFEGKFA